MTDAAGPVPGESGADAASPDAASADAAGAAVAAARLLVADAAAALAAGGARQETLAALAPERRVLGIPRAARMTPTGRVWRLGVLLLDDSGGAWDTGRVVRAERAARKSITAESVAEQRALRAAAVRGGIPEGETVAFDANPIDFEALARDRAAGPLVVRDGEVLVRWNPTSPEALAPLARYLAERVELLANPPERA
ncbi:hypothetical protein [Agromyces sp. PvR057]|uniref:hypothetical protein n=1 Tax=Agromyces sp. PvR057 TaxID=3156403 RepID=UPI000E37C79E